MPRLTTSPRPYHHINVSNVRKIIFSIYSDEVCQFVWRRNKIPTCLKHATCKASFDISFRYLPTPVCRRPCMLCSEKQEATTIIAWISRSIVIICADDSLQHLALTGIAPERRSGLKTTVVHVGSMWAIFASGVFNLIVTTPTSIIICAPDRSLNMAYLHTTNMTGVGSLSVRPTSIPATLSVANSVSPWKSVSNSVSPRQVTVRQLL